MIPPGRRRLYKHEQAKQDLIEIYAHLSSRDRAVAEHFLAEAHKAFNLILQMPGVGRKWRPSISWLPNLRVSAVPRPFRKYLIFYRPVADGVQIVAVVYGTRDLNFILDSLRVEDDLGDAE